MLARDDEDHFINACCFGPLYRWNTEETKHVVGQISEMYRPRLAEKLQHLTSRKDW